MFGGHLRLNEIIHVKYLRSLADPPHTGSFVCNWLLMSFCPGVPEIKTYCSSKVCYVVFNTSKTHKNEQRECGQAPPWCALWFSSFHRSRVHVQQTQVRSLGPNSTTYDLSKLLYFQLSQVPQSMRNINKLLLLKFWRIHWVYVLGA